MHAGTTSDIFLRENLEWLGLASNWSKFSATAALGVIHKGHFEESMNILGPYLPQRNGAESGIPGAAYSEGGALYALGLVNAGVGSGQHVEEYLRETLKNAQSEVVQHGAALGLGVAGMGGKNAETYEELKQALFTDSANAGEAAGYAMGLIMLGTADKTSAEEMLMYARETQHEKIIRGIAIGLAFIYYGRQEEADDMVKTLLAEKVCQLPDRDIRGSSHLTFVGSYSPVWRCLHGSARLRRHFQQQRCSTASAHCCLGHVGRRPQSSSDLACVLAVQEPGTGSPDRAAAE